MCCLALNIVYHDKWNPFQCGTSMWVSTWPQNKTTLRTKDLLMFLLDLARLSAINLSILITYKSTLAPDQKITHHYPLRSLAWSMNLMMLSLPPNHHGSVMQQKCLTMPHGCLGSINWTTPSKHGVLVPALQKATPQGHQHTGHCTSGGFQMKVSLSIQIQTRFQAIPKRKRAGASLRQHTIWAQPSHKSGGSSPALIGPQPVFAECSHMFFYTKLKMTTSPYWCVSEIFFK